MGCSSHAEIVKLVRMFRTVLTALFLLFGVIPTMAQEDFERLQVGVSGANLRLPAGGTTSSRHVGLIIQAGFNFTRWVGIENHTAFYSLGSGNVLRSNIIGAKITARPAAAPFMIPYGVVGVGVGHITTGGYKFGSGSMKTTRFALGSDFPLTPLVSLRLDVGLLSVYPDSTQNGINGALGFVFNLKR